MTVLLLNAYGVIINNGIIITPLELTGDRWCWGMGWLDVTALDFNAYFPVGSYSIYVLDPNDIMP